ncbi:hypothetical protein [Jiangella endophytica]|uniref:hypothetical protein n=1 Tax=Jiangella endophytica TaxID=1623398 RepID=UPI00130060DA|nr:hypothetical protein [Jiangella endophytica]
MIRQLVRLLDPANSSEHWRERWAARGVIVPGDWPLMVDKAFRQARQTWPDEIDETDSRIREVLFLKVAQWHRFGCPGCDVCPTPRPTPLGVGGLVAWMRQRATDAWRKERAQGSLFALVTGEDGEPVEDLESAIARYAGDLATITNDGYAAMPEGDRCASYIYGCEVAARERALATVDRFERAVFEFLGAGYTVAEVHALLPEPKPTLAALRQRVTRARKRARSAAVFEPMVHGSWPAPAVQGNVLEGYPDSDCSILDGVRSEEFPESSSEMSNIAA